MSELNSVDTALLEVIAGMKNGKADGAYNIRKDSGCADRVNTDNVTITSTPDKPGIDVTFVPGCKESCHIPVIITESGLRETVYNDFYVGEGADVVIIAGCGIHNCGEDASQHDGIHAFHIGKNARVKYVEKHYGEGDGLGENIMNPTTIAYLDEGAVLQMETSQIAGIDSTKRVTRVECGKGAEVVRVRRGQEHLRRDDAGGGGVFFIKGQAAAEQRLQRRRGSRAGPCLHKLHIRRRFLVIAQNAIAMFFVLQCSKQFALYTCRQILNFIQKKYLAVSLSKITLFVSRSTSKRTLFMTKHR